MIAESLIGFVLGYFSGLVAGVIAVIVLFLLERRGKSTTLSRLQMAAQIGNPTWPQSFGNTTSTKPEEILKKNQPLSMFEKSISEYEDYKKAAQFREAKGQDGRESSQENG